MRYFVVYWESVPERDGANQPRMFVHAESEEEAREIAISSMESITNLHRDQLRRIERVESTNDLEPV